ncbi:hypothetical protein SY2F82_51360 [Streptomyces sp. Y2F8-2]|nr:hypothetical protein SY2F82_51360 [Streptomyces sp. Y2F8-2]
MRTASVARGEGARIAAAVSLVLASAKVRDHMADGDGPLARAGGVRRAPDGRELGQATDVTVTVTVTVAATADVPCRKDVPHVKQAHDLVTGAPW